MISKIYSWLLASAWLAWGIFLLLLIPRLQVLYSGFGFSVPSLVRLMFIAGPVGCLLLATMTGTAVALNTHKFHLRFLSMMLTIPLLAWVGYLADVVSNTFMRE